MGRQPKSIHCYLLASLLSCIAVQVAAAVLPEVSPTYFPPSIALIELEYMLKKLPTVRFRSRRKTRRLVQEFKDNPQKSKPFLDEFEEARLIDNELEEVLRDFRPTIGGWGAGKNYSFRKRIWIPFVGTIVLNSGKITGSMSVSADPETFEDWRALSEDNFRQQLIDALQTRFEECQEKFSSKTSKLSWTKPPGPPAGLCELIYEIKEIGPPPPDGALEIDVEKELAQARLEERLKWEEYKYAARSLWAKLQGKEPKRPQCRIVERQYDGKPRKRTPHEILGEAARDSLDKAKPWINAYSSSRRLKVRTDAVHMFSHYGTKTTAKARRARRIIQKALEKKAAEYPDWFQVSFPYGNQTVSFLTMDSKDP